MILILNEYESVDAFWKGTVTNSMIEKRNPMHAYTVRLAGIVDMTIRNSLVVPQRSSED